MKKLIIFQIFIISFIGIVTQNLVAQSTNDAEQKAFFKKTTDSLDYGATEMKWKLKEREVREKEAASIDLPTSVNIDGGITNSIAYILIVVLLVAVMFMIFGNMRFDKKIDNETITSDFIEDIEEIDALDGFKQALRAGDYRSAIRMQFIKVLQILQENNSIKWKPEKTNKDYLRELNGTKQKNEFRKLSGIYELVWYGNTKIERDTFEQLNPSFEKFINDSDGK